MKNIFKIFALLFAMGIFVVACDEVNLDEPQIDEEISQDNALASKTVGDVFAAVNTGRNTGKSTNDECFAATYTVATRTLVLEYPAEGCTGIDGVSRAGVITAVFSGDTWTAGTTVTITFTDYSRNGHPLTGTIVASHEGFDESQNPMFNILSRGDLTMTFDDERTIVWNFDTDLKWIDGWDTPLLKADDAWVINGTSSGTGRNGKTFSRTDTDLTTSPTCPWFVSGTIDLVIGESDELSMVFTACGTVTFTYRGITITKSF